MIQVFFISKKQTTKGGGVKKGKGRKGEKERNS